MNVTVRDLMSVQTCSIESTATFGEALSLMLREGIGELYVTNPAGQLAGAVHDYSLLKGQLNRSPADRPVSALMDRSVTTVDAECSALEIASLFRESRFRRMAVVENSRLVGYLERRNLMRFLCEQEHPSAPTQNRALPDESAKLRSHSAGPDPSETLPQPKHTFAQQRSSGTLQSR